MLKQTLRFLFPKTIDKIVAEEVELANIIHNYGSIEQYEQDMQDLVEYGKSEDLRIQAELEAEEQLDKLLEDL